MFVQGKYTSLFVMSVRDEEKMFYNSETGA